VYLLHGTRYDKVLNIIDQGLNERFAGSCAGTRFGAGNYFADDAGKTDQYATHDEQSRGHGTGAGELYSRLYANTEPLTNVFYVFVCRVVLGEFLETRQGLPRISSLFATTRHRELKSIPGTTPPQPYHSLIARVCTHAERASGPCPHHCALAPGRFSEYISFHDCRVYPEYLVAYRRE